MMAKKTASVVSISDFVRNFYEEILTAKENNEAAPAPAPEDVRDLLVGEIEESVKSGAIPAYGRQGSVLECLYVDAGSIRNIFESLELGAREIGAVSLHEIFENALSLTTKFDVQSARPKTARPGDIIEVNAAVAESRRRMSTHLPRKTARVFNLS